MAHDRKVLEAPDARLKTDIPMLQPSDQDVVPAAVSSVISMP